jgi:hypothetical protein
MIDVILIVVAFISTLFSVFGYKYLLTKGNSTNISDTEKVIDLLRTEQLRFNKKSSNKRKIIYKEIEKISGADIIEIYHTARKNRLPVGEILLAARIKSFK